MTKGRANHGKQQQMELPFAAFESIRAARARVHDALVSNCVGISPTLKRLLQVLHRRCCGKQICWPSRRLIAEDLGYSWPTSERTITRQIHELKRRGLVMTQVRLRPDGGQSSTVYCIRYCQLRYLQGQEGSSRGTRERVSKHLPPRQYCLPPSSLLSSPPRQECLPPSSLLSTHELKRKEIETNRTPSVRGPLIPAKRTDGGRVEESSGIRKSGWWAFRFERDDLKDQSEMLRLYKLACQAGVVTNNIINQVRFLALVLHVKAVPAIDNVTGYIVTTLERGAWNCLPKRLVAEAAAKVGGDALKLTPEQLLEVRTACPAGHSANEV